MSEQPLPALNPADQVFAETRGEAPGRGRLQGRRILVVGGGQQPSPEADPPIGNGRAMCLLFAREAATVACADRDGAAAAATVTRIAAAGGKALAITADVADPPQIERMVREASAQLGGLDGVVFNVGIGGAMWLEGQSPEAWDQAFAVNLRGAMLTCRAALPVLEAGGAIVLISSVASLRAGTQMPAYDTSKAALAGLCRHVALEGQRRGIRANVLAPGLIDTPLGRSASRGRPSRNRQRLPFGRQGTGWEVAYGALFLMSHEAGYVNGQVLVVDGGITSSVVR